ncbi:MAG: hypothetical protein ABSE93_17605 [Terriglobia bacterium]
MLGSSFADDGANDVDPNVAANDETNVAANDETNVAANDETNVAANDETNVAGNGETNVAGNDEHNPRWRRQRAGVGRGLEMHGPGKETLHARDGEGFGQEDGEKERGTLGLGQN